MGGQLFVDLSAFGRYPFVWSVCLSDLGQSVPLPYPKISVLRPTLLIGLVGQSVLHLVNELVSGLLVASSLVQSLLWLVGPLTSLSVLWLVC